MLNIVTLDEPCHQTRFIFKLYLLENYVEVDKAKKKQGAYTYC
jgi:hypothetical protein